MNKIPTVFFVLLLISLASAWENENYIDFANVVLNESECNVSSFNTTKIIINESRNYVDYEDLFNYMQTPNCENYVKGSYYYLGMNDPTPSCNAFYKTVHEWVNSGVWNWGFVDCGIEFRKYDWDNLVLEYSQGYWLGELEEPIKVVEKDYPIYTNDSTEINEKSNNIDNWYNNLGGGGVDPNFIWATWIIIANYMWIELLILVFSFYIARFYWTRKTWKDTERYSVDPFMNTNISWFKKLKIWGFWFILVSIVFWICFFVFL